MEMVHLWLPKTGMLTCGRKPRPAKIEGIEQPDPDTMTDYIEEVTCPDCKERLVRIDLRWRERKEHSV